MPPLSRYAIRASFVHLALGVTFGALVLTVKGLLIWPWIWNLRTAHIHLLLVGWTVQLAFGVGYWILPRLDASGRRGRERSAVVGCIALNLAVLLGVGASITQVYLGASVQRWLDFSVGGLYALMGVLLALHLWPRIAKPKF